MNIYDYCTLTNSQLEKELGTSLSRGLSAPQLIEYQKKYGPNSLNNKSSSSFALFLRQFTSPFTYLLIAAATLSLLVGDTLNALIILLIVGVNGLLGFYQEYKAEQALKILRVHLIMTAKVIRNGADVVIPNTQLVPGDVIKLQPGDYIPADVRFTEGSVFVDESTLTGESAPVKKTSEPLSAAAKDVYQALNLGLFGTTVTSGNATALVVGTGENTLFGNISSLSISTLRESGFQEVLRRLSSFILVLICITLVGLFVFHLLIKGPHTDIIQLLLFCIAIALGITPEALPTVTTFALSRGALQLAHHNVVVKRLAAIEDLGSITILCTDKTGTLTENKLSVSSIYDVRKNAFGYALLASKKTEPLDPFDKALWAHAQQEDKDNELTYKRVYELPFDPVKRRNITLVAKDDEHDAIIRGAYESIGALCSNVDNADIKRWIDEQSHAGNRILAIASKKISVAMSKDEFVAWETQLASAKNGAESLDAFTLEGLIAFQDPVKTTALPAIAKARALGITLKMITGDSKEVACAVAQQVGLSNTPDCAITGAEFEMLSLEEQQRAVQTFSVFARILPEQKYTIVNLLKTMPGEHPGQQPIVGYLGEGINDAPALKAAHVGLAVQGASDIAQDAADIILLRKSLMVIVEGIALGRNVFSNTLKYIVAVLSSTFGNFYSLAIASLVLDFLPQLPLQVLLVNLLSDFPMVAIATDTSDPGELKRPQEFNLKSIALLSLILGLVCPVFDFMFFAIFYRFGAATVQTNWFIQSILMELALIYSVRTRKIFFKASRPSYVLMALSLIVGAITIALPFTAIGQKVFHFQTTDLHTLLIVGAIVLAYFLTTDAVKLSYFALSGNANFKRKKIKPA